MEEFFHYWIELNRLARNSPGFVWRLAEDEEESARIDGRQDRPLLLNLSVWEDLESIFNYVYGKPHLRIMKEGTKWIEPTKEAHYVLWWIPGDHTPDLEEAENRLKMIRKTGPSENAFDFRHRFPHPSAVVV